MIIYFVDFMSIYFFDLWKYQVCVGVVVGVGVFGVFDFIVVLICFVWWLILACSIQWLISGVKIFMNRIVSIYFFG